MNNLSAWALRNPIPTTVLLPALTVAGLWGFGALRVSDMPDIGLPMVAVSGVRTGAAPAEIETQLTDAIGNAVAGAAGVEGASSTVSEGSSVTSIEFDLDAGLTKAADDVRNAVTGIESRLPATAETPTAARADAGDQAIPTCVVDAPGMAPDALSRFADNDVSKALLKVDGVSKITRSGGVSRAILVKLDPDRLNALGVTVRDISQALAAHTADRPGGRTVVGEAEQSVRTLGRTSSVRDLGNLPFAPGLGADAESRAPMAIAVIGGLVSSTVLSLVHVPVVHTPVDDPERWTGRLPARLLPRQGAAAAPPEGGSGFGPGRTLTHIDRPNRPWTPPASRSRIDETICGIRFSTSLSLAARPASEIGAPRIASAPSRTTSSWEAAPSSNMSRLRRRTDRDKPADRRRHRA